MIGKMLPAYIATLPDLTAIVGTKVRPGGVKPIDELPYISYLQTGRLGVDALDGPSGLAGARLRVMLDSTTKEEVRRMARLLAGPVSGELRLNGFAGIIAGLDIKTAMLEDEREIYLTPAQSSGIGLYEVQQEWVVYYDESAAAID